MKFFAGIGLVIVSVVLALILLAGSPTRVASAAFAVLPTFSAPVQATGLTETWTISGWQGSNANQLTSVTIMFPDGFVMPPSPNVTVTTGGLPCTVLHAATTGQSVSVEMVGICPAASASAALQSITIAGVKNPATFGTKAASGFTLTTNVDSTVAAASDVVIWGVSVSPITCRQTAGDLSVGQVKFTSTAGTAMGNTGSGPSYPLTITTTLGSFLESPFLRGLLGTPGPISSGATVALGAVPPAMAAASSMTAEITVLAMSGTATVTLSAIGVTSGPPVVLGTGEVTFSSGTCVPPAAPVGTGTFSGGTIAPAGVSIVAFTGTTAQLNTAGASAKLVSVTATVGGKLITYVVGAPDFVNVDFNAAFPTGLSATLVIVKA